MMADILVQQQTSLTKAEIVVPMEHEVDKGLFFYQQDPTGFLHFLKTFTNEPQRSISHSASKKFFDTNSLPSSNEEEMHNFNGDVLKPIIKEDKISDKLDSILTSTKLDELNGDSILNSNSSLNTEAQVRRRKWRTPITRTSASKSDSVEHNNSNQEEKLQDLKEILEQISLNENSEKTHESSDTTISSGRLRGRRLRFRSHQHVSPISQESTSDNHTQFYTSNGIQDSPTSSTTNVFVSIDSLSISTGVLRRTHCIERTKKVVRFADSVGRQLVQVQYFQSFTDDDEDSMNFPFLNNNMYVPKSLDFEHKPWTFDVELPSKQTPDIRVPKKFFCLYRQPNSEHPDIYLHEVWKSQIKLEFASIRLKSSLTGEQYLYGTAWVTNAGYHKNVTLQYTFSRWSNKHEYQAKHLFHSNDFRNLDKFEFNIDIPNDIDRVDFVLHYRVNGQEHWDNNEGKNYSLETESAYSPQTTISLPHDCNFDEMRFY
ncbi:unnamed protein product [Rotaria socialis]|uniref:CBM21 domain-containing protein n=1 Tax=Rotaria socialis TaxID=392032 RepID=A0A820QR70_9BILA|nr:unnamed protein product [Rotaria socialis]CAF4423965.1 unnamed protein product [Rotaria socialis]